MKRGSVANRILDRYVGIPVLRITSFFHRPRRRPSSLNRIGILVSPTLGDTIISSAAIRDLRAHFSQAELIFFSTPTSEAVVGLLPGIDRIVPITLTRPFQTLRTIRHCQLDLLIDFTPWQRLTAFYTAASGAKYRVGFRSENQCRHWHYDLTADHTAKVHEVDNFRGLLRAIGITPSSDPQLKFECDKADASTECAYIKVVFHPWATGDRHSLREWPEERWVELAQRLTTSSTLFLVTGSPAQLQRSKQLVGQLETAGVRAKAFVGDKGIQSLCELLKESRLVVSVNTGVMHLAAVLGTSTIALNGPTASHRWGPVGPSVASVAPRGVGCGYLHLGFEFDDNPTDCMERTDIEDVLSAVRQLRPDLLNHLNQSASSRQAADC